MTRANRSTDVRRLAATTLAAALLLAACGSDDGTSAEDDDGAGTEAAADAGAGDGSGDAADADADQEQGDDQGDEAEAAVTLDPSEVVPGPLSIVAIDFTTAEVTLVNNSDAEINLDEHWMCNFPNYAQIVGVGPIGPGETLTVSSTVAIPGNDGELGIYSAEDFGNAEAIVAYAEWGDGVHGRSEVAVEAKIWTGVPLTSDGSSLTVSG